MRSGLLIVIQLSLDLLRQALTEFNTPLIKAVDVPDSTLGEGEVLVVDNQGTQSGGCDLVSQDRCSGSVTQEGLVGNKVVGSTLSLNLVGSLADHESLSLSEEVGSQHPRSINMIVEWRERPDLLLVLVVLDGVMALGSHDEVSRDELSALVEQLVEGMLSVGRRLAK